MTRRGVFFSSFLNLNYHFWSIIGVVKNVTCAPENVALGKKALTNQKYNQNKVRLNTKERCSSQEYWP
jgi:hypothetical protein